MINLEILSLNHISFTAYSQGVQPGLVSQLQIAESPVNSTSDDDDGSGFSHVRQQVCSMKYWDSGQGLTIALFSAPLAPRFTYRYAHLESHSVLCTACPLKHLLTDNLFLQPSHPYRTGIVLQHEVQVEQNLLELCNQSPMLALCHKAMDSKNPQSPINKPWLQQWGVRSFYMLNIPQNNLMLAISR